MTDQDKADHILTEIADDAFNLLVCKDCSTITSILTECKRFKQAKSRRITKKFRRLPNTAATSSCEAPVSPPRLPAETTADTVTHIVRREIQAMTPVTAQHFVADVHLPTVSVIQAVGRDEIACMGMQPACHMSHLVGGQFPANAASCNHYGPAQSSTDSFCHEYRPWSYRNPAQWKTSDDRPIYLTAGVSVMLPGIARATGFLPLERLGKQNRDGPSYGRQATPLKRSDCMP